MKSRTGIFTSLGSSVVHTGSVKQQIKTSSTTHSELVGVSDALPKILWGHYFCEAQGYLVDDVYVYQYNQSAILLENNGAQSIVKGSRHIRIKYVFITDKVKYKEVKVIYCPTKQMMAYFFTKPLQGAIYIVHRNEIMGINNDDMPIYIKAYKQYREARELAESIVKP